MKVNVIVICHECEDENGDAREMIGSKDMYINKEMKTQSREYECPDCKKIISVNLEF